MIAITALTLLSTLGIAFYTRFLIVLCKECRRQRICHLVRLRSYSAEHKNPVDRRLDSSSRLIARY